MAMDIDAVESLVREATDAFCSGEYDLGYVTDDCSNSVDLEEIKISRFVAAGCKCKLANGNPCSQLFSASMYRSLRDECHALTRDQLDLVVMGQLRALVRNDKMTQKQNPRMQSVFGRRRNFVLVGIMCVLIHSVFCTQ